MQDTWIVLIPPIIVIAFAFLTHRIFFALILGLLSATFIATDFAIIESFHMAIKYVWNISELQNLSSLKLFFDSDNLMLILFSFLLGIITTLIINTGGAKAYQTLINKRVKDKKDVEKATLNLSWFFFLDDYFGSLTVGSVMRPITDQFKIPRIKLSVLVNSIAGPLCLIVPISSWGAVIMMNLEKSGISNGNLNQNITIHADPFYLYLNFIPFIFYSIIIIASTWFAVLKKISFGIIYRQEQIAKNTGNLFGGKIPINRNNFLNKTQSNLFDFLFPIISLVISIFSMVLYTGNYHLLGGSNNFVETLKSAEFIRSLFIGGCISFLGSSILYLSRNKISLKKYLYSIIEGIELIGPSLVVLILAWSLADILNTQLFTGQYLANLLVGKIGIQLLPLMFFVVTATIAIAIGSAWGTLAIMIPLAVQMLISMFNLTPPVELSQLPIIYPVLGAILSGAVTGNHLSPTADTMVMSSTSTAAYHMDHVKGQHVYAIPALISTAIAFLFAGFFINYNTKIVLIFSLGIGIAINFALLTILNQIKNHISEN
ncbi:MAG: Na+/H+ antiporter NhaC family protein [bacterium]